MIDQLPEELGLYESKKELTISRHDRCLFEHPLGAASVVERLITGVIPTRML
jgi:hypothetical protein